MERLVEDEQLRVRAMQVLSHAQIEAPHNSRLRSALAEKSDEKEGRCIIVHIYINTYMYVHNL